MAAIIRLAPPKSSTIPKCTPNLMPFHIAHTGHAPISTYFRPKPAPVSALDASTALSSNIEPEAQVETQAESQTETETETQTLTASTSASSTTVVSETNTPPETDSTKLKLNDDSQPDVTKAEIIATTTQLVVETKPIAFLQSAIKRLSSTAKRFVASFRGRTMHGVDVELPEGYTGLILRGPPNGDVDLPVRGKAQEKGRRAKRGSRKVIEVDKDEQMDIDGGGGEEEEGTVRTLEPAGQFSSFVLWHPDFQVDEGRDEYLRTLTEWIGLAAEIHRVEEVD